MNPNLESSRGRSKTVTSIEAIMPATATDDHEKERERLPKFFKILEARR